MASFSIGARGLCVLELQIAMGALKPDGKFGARTRDAVMSLQSANGMTPNGFADPRFYSFLNMRFPSEFDRCLGLTCAFEGTGFGECNSTDIDNAGLTFGIVGFTSRHGEVQTILLALLGQQPNMLQVFSPARAAELQKLIQNTIPSAQKWGEFFYGADFKHRNSKGMRVLPDIPRAFSAWGHDPLMRRLQLDAAKMKWKRALEQCTQLQFQSMNARGLFFDIVVQNGSFTPAAANLFGKMYLDGAPESIRLEGVAQAVAAGANVNYRADVLARKLIFGRGSGEIHGSSYNLASQGF